MANLQFEVGLQYYQKGRKGYTLCMGIKTCCTVLAKTLAKHSRGTKPDSSRLGPRHGLAMATAQQNIKHDATKWLCS